MIGGLTDAHNLAVRAGFVRENSRTIQRIQKLNNAAEREADQSDSAIGGLHIWSQRHRKSLIGKCRRGDLNFQALHESVTYRLYERIECLERIKRIQHTHSAHTSSRWLRTYHREPIYRRLTNNRHWRGIDHDLA